MSARTIELPFRLTKAQSRVFRSKKRFLVCCAGRRFGKTVLALQWLVTEVASGPEGALGYYVAPYRVMAKAIAWDLLLKITRGWRKSYNVAELSVTLPGDRKIALKGADDVRAEAARINAKLGPWLFRLPVFNLENMRRRLDDLLEPKDT